MKRMVLVLCVVALLCGCSTEDGISEALRLRSDLHNSSLCSFDATIMADYGDRTYRFVLSCVAAKGGDMTFVVNEPESISGITGKLSREGGALTFDDVALYFPMLAEELITPVAGPWAFLTALSSGYMQSAGEDGVYTRMMIRDSFQDRALSLDIWLDEANVPVQADVIWENRRILSMQIRNFVLS